MFQSKTYVEILKNELRLRKIKNPNYSLRAYARDLDIAASNLSLIIADKKGLSVTSAINVAQKLKLDKTEQEYFVALVKVNSSRSKEEREIAKNKIKKMIISTSKEVLDEEKFKILSDWYHYAILELLEIKGSNHDSRWIAEQLDVSESEIQNALERLEKLGFVIMENGNYQSSGVQLETTQELASESIKKFNKQIILKANKSIDEQSVKDRHLSTLTIAINTDDLEYYKSKIIEFKYELDHEIMKRNKVKGANRVYCFSSQFFSLQKF